MNVRILLNEISCLPPCLPTLDQHPPSLMISTQSLSREVLGLILMQPFILLLKSLIAFFIIPCSLLSIWLENLARKKIALNVPFYLYPHTHYVDWDFNGKNTSHLRFLQKPFILDVPKKNENFLCGSPEIFPFIHFEIAWTGRINQNLKIAKMALLNPCMKFKKILAKSILLKHYENGNKKFIL